MRRHSLILDYNDAQILCFVKDTLCCEVKSCGVCNQCQLWSQDQHPSWRSIHPNKSGNINLDEVLPILDWSSTTSMQGDIKVVAIYQADKLTISSQNALLKELEEIDNKTVWLFFSQSQYIDKILLTVRSRLQVIRSDNDNTDNIIKSNWLPFLKNETLEIPNENLEEIAFGLHQLLMESDDLKAILNYLNRFERYILLKKFTQSHLKIRTMSKISLFSSSYKYCT